MPLLPGPLWLTSAWACRVRSAPWRGGGQREVHAQAICWPPSIPPLHRPLQLSLPSRQPSLLWLKSPGLPKSSYFPNLAQKPPEIKGSYIHHRKSHITLWSPVYWLGGGGGAVPRLPQNEQNSSAGVWKGPVSLACYSPPCDRAGPGIAPQALYTRPPPPTTSSHKVQNRPLSPSAITHHHFAELA